MSRFIVLLVVFIGKLLSYKMLIICVCLFRVSYSDVIILYAFLKKFGSKEIFALNEYAGLKSIYRFESVGLL